MAEKELLEEAWLLFSLLCRVAWTVPFLVRCSGSDPFGIRLLSV